MKVPIQYKSSTRYNAGVDVIYDDESKLQYAPFIYAGTESGDNGPDEGGDEEGEDSMVVIYDSATGSIDKSFKGLKDAVNAGKTVILKNVALDDETGVEIQIAYLSAIENQSDGKYNAYFSTVVSPDDTYELYVIHVTATNETDNMVLASPGE